MNCYNSKAKLLTTTKKDEYYKHMLLSKRCCDYIILYCTTRQWPSAQLDNLLCFKVILCELKSLQQKQQLTYTYSEIQNSLTLMPTLLLHYSCLSICITVHTYSPDSTTVIYAPSLRHILATSASQPFTICHFITFHFVRRLFMQCVCMYVCVCAFVFV